MPSHGGRGTGFVLVLGLAATVLAISGCTGTRSLGSSKPGESDAKAACQLMVGIDPNTSASDGLTAIGQAADKASAAADQDESYRPLSRSLHKLETAITQASVKKFNAAWKDVSKNCGQL